jgi:hypothetical protein
MRRYALTFAACLALAGAVELLVGGPGPHIDPAPVELDGASPEARRVDTKRPRSRSRREPIRRSRPDRAEGPRPRGSGSASGGEPASGGGGSGPVIVATRPPVAVPDRAPSDDAGAVERDDDPAPAPAPASDGDSEDDDDEAAAVVAGREPDDHEDGGDD